MCLRKSVSFNSSSPIAELELKRNLQVALAAVASQKHGIDRLLPLKKKNLAGPPVFATSDAVSVASAQI